MVLKRSHLLLRTLTQKKDKYLTLVSESLTFALVHLSSFRQAFVQQAIAGLASELGSIPGPQEGHVARRDQLVARLAESGKWFAFKEQMKAAVSKVHPEILSSYFTLPLLFRRGCLVFVI